MAIAKIIGLAGTNGSGKDTVGYMLAEWHNYLFVSVTDIMREELKRRGLPPAREHMRNLSAEWRREFGYGVLVTRAVDLFKEAGDKYAGVVMASLRNPYEADEIHKLGGLMVWVDADSKVRYERIQAGAAARGADRAVDDQKSFEQFLADEDAEMHRQAGADEATLNMAAVKEKSDIFLENNGNDLEVFKNDAEKALLRR